MARLLTLILLLLVIALGLSFAALNAESVQVHYYFGGFSAPLAMVVAMAIAAGAMLGILASLGIVLAQRLELSSLKKKIALCEREVRNLREIPFKEPH